MSQAVQGLTLALFTRLLEWTPEQVEVFLVDIRKEFKDRRIHAYWPVYVLPISRFGESVQLTSSLRSYTIYAQKPE